MRRSNERRSAEEILEATVIFDAGQSHLVRLGVCFDLFSDGAVHWTSKSLPISSISAFRVLAIDRRTRAASSLRAPQITGV